MRFMTDKMMSSDMFSGFVSEMANLLMAWHKPYNEPSPSANYL
jgi:hypothetical protein